MMLGTTLSYISPWLTNNVTERLVVHAFNKQWENVSDGCGLGCDHCGVKNIERVAFGRQVELAYTCGGPLPEPITEANVNRRTIFVSFIGYVSLPSRH